MQQDLAELERLRQLEQDYIALQAAYTQLEQAQHHHLNVDPSLLCGDRRLRAPQWNSERQVWLTDVLEVHERGEENDVLVSFVACAHLRRDEYALSEDGRRLLLRAHVAHACALSSPES
jgi:hypothetical protein